jgi:predicted  nucleic acid-binding Zn-ribbon protein
MTQANEPNDRNREIDRQLRSLRRRTDRLEYSQVSPQEFSRAFDRVYDEIDELEDTINARFDRIEGEVRELRSEFGELRSEIRTLSQKFDIVMQYITGQGEAS